MKNAFILLALCGLFVGCSKYYGEPTTVTIPVSSSYNALNVSHGFEVTVSDAVNEVVVTVGEKAVDKLKVEVRNGTLYIGFGWWENYVGTATAVIPASAVLNDIELSGASSFTGNMNGDELNVDLSGASKYKGSMHGKDIDIDMSGASVVSATADVESIDLHASGASDANLSGACLGEMEIDLSGASTLKASDFDTRAVTGEMSGASNAEVTCCELLEVSLSGGSHIYYWVLSGCTPAVNCPCSGGSNATPRW